MAAAQVVQMYVEDDLYDSLVTVFSEEIDIMISGALCITSL